MKNIVVGAALVAALFAGPAIAGENRAMKEKKGSQQSTSTSKQDETRHLSDDGTLQGKPVVEGPANWDSAASDSAGSGNSGGSDSSSGSGSSSGESGSTSGSKSSSP